MKRMTYSTLAIAILLSIPCGASAQKGGGGGVAPQPNVTPYLGLLRSSPARNYYSNVVPQQQNLAAFNRQEQINQEYAQDFTEGVLTTGHRSSFQTHQRFFQNHTGATSGIRTPQRSAGTPQSGYRGSGYATDAYGGGSGYGQPAGGIGGGRRR